MMGWSPRCYIPSFVKIRPPVLEKKIFEGFYHIWAWRPSWSCDPDAANKISFPLPKEAPHKIWLLSAQRFRRRRCLKLFTTTDDGQTTDGRLLDGYPISSPPEPNSSGELKRSYHDRGLCLISLHYTSDRVFRFRCAYTIIYIQGIPGSYGYRSLEIIYYIYIYII